MSIWCIWPDIHICYNFTALFWTRLEKVFRRDRRHAHGRFSCCRQRWLRINKCTKFRHKREKKEKKAQQKAHKNRNGRLWGVIKTPKVVKIAEDTTFCERQRGLGGAAFSFLEVERGQRRDYNCVRAWVLVIHAVRLDFSARESASRVHFNYVAMWLQFSSHSLGLGLPSMYVFVWLATTVACCLLQTLLYFCFTVSVSALSSPQQTHKSTQRKPHLGWIRKKQNKILFEGFSGREGKAESVGTLSDYVQQGVDSQIKRNRIHRYSICIEKSLFQAHL